MDFEFSAEQDLLRDTVRRAAAQQAPLAALRAAYGTDAVATTSAWDGLRDLGLCGLLVPEPHGGAGMGMTDAGVVAEELGRALHPSPWLSSCVGAATLVGAAGDADDHARLLPGLADGSVVGTVATVGVGPAREVAVVETDGHLVGTLTHVPDAPLADLLLVGTADAVWAVDLGEAGAAASVTSTPSVDGSRVEGTVVLEGAPARRLATGEAAATAVAATFDRLAVGQALDGLGAAARALELAVAYAKERVQFDQPIGAFQAVQHLCADMLRDLELGRVAAYFALWAADAGDPAEAHRAATMAKAWASEAFPRIGATAIQVFAGIGFTWEHDVHLFYKRALTVGSRYGRAAEHYEELARLVM